MSAPRGVRVTYDDGDRFQVVIDGHRLTVDQPSEDGGGDAGPTPTELFVASLVACMGFFGQRFLRRNGIDTRGVELIATFTTAERPHRVGTIDIAVSVPDIEDVLVEPLQRVLHRCTVHNSLTTPPDLNVTIRRRLPGALAQAVSERPGR